jgi:hypothetical protein
MKTLNDGTQVLNIHYRQELAPDVLNKIFYKVFTAGVIEGTFEFGLDSVTISSVSFLIAPQNQSDLLVRIDTTEPITIKNTSPTNVYLTARYRWENENTGAEFLFADDSTIVETDVILVGLVLDEDGKISSLDYDVQERAKLKLIQTNTAFPLISKLDGYGVGHDYGQIPVSDGILNSSLNAQYFNGKEVTKFAVSKQLPQIVTGGDIATIIEPTLPEWMDGVAVGKGEGVTAEFVMDKKVQPQDGTTKPGTQNQIPVANTVLQKDLNIEFLGGHLHTEFAKTTHSHSLDEIFDNGNPSAPNYIRILAVKNNLATGDSIEEDDIEYTNVDMIAYDPTISNRFQPVYETGDFDLAGAVEGTVTFQRPMKNARIILQRAPKSIETVVAGAEKRTARITEITNAGFKAKQMGSIIKSGATYIRTDASDAAANQYYWFAIGEKV